MESSFVVDIHLSVQVMQTVVERQASIVEGCGDTCRTQMMTERKRGLLQIAT
jgi:hypothetical protein